MARAPPDGRGALPRGVVSDRPFDDVDGEAARRRFLEDVIAAHRLALAHHAHCRACECDHAEGFVLDGGPAVPLPADGCG